MAHVTRTKNVKSRKLVTLDEAFRLDKSEIVLLTLGKEPLKIKKLPYTEHPFPGSLSPRELSEYKDQVTEKAEGTETQDGRPGLSRLDVQKGPWFRPAQIRSEDKNCPAKTAGLNFFG